MRVNYSIKRDRAGDRVVCGTRHCETPLGFIIEDDNDNDDPPALWLPIGWTFRDDGGYWAVSNRAKRRIAQGKRAESRSQWMSTGVDGPMGWTLTLQRPESIECYKCGRIQPIDRVALGLVPLSTDWGDAPQSIHEGQPRAFATGLIFEDDSWDDLQLLRMR